VLEKGELADTKPIGFLEDELTHKVTFDNVEVLIELKALSPLGPAIVKFTGVSLLINPCFSEGAMSGTVELPSAEYHTVAVSLVVGGSKVLDQELLLLFKEFTFKCAKVNVKVKAPLLLTLVVTPNTEVTSFGVTAKCAGAGKQELNTYFNDAGTQLLKQLLL
jgi:hypothetical protein